MFEEKRDRYSDLFTIKEFAAAVVYGTFIPDDGSGYYGTENAYNYSLSVWGIPVQEAQQKGATHVHWYNK